MSRNWVTEEDTTLSLARIASALERIADAADLWAKPHSFITYEKPLTARQARKIKRNWSRAYGAQVNRAVPGCFVCGDTFHSSWFHGVSYADLRPPGPDPGRPQK